MDESCSPGGFGGFLSRRMEREAILLIGLNAVRARSDFGDSAMFVDVVLYQSLWLLLSVSPALDGRTLPF